VEEFDRLGSPKLSGHLWTDVFRPSSYSLSNPAMPLLLVFWVVFILTFFRNLIFENIFRLKVFANLKVANFEIDENLDNYFNTLDDEDREWSLKEEQNAREVCGMKILLDETIMKLKTTTLGKNHMKGIHTYDILANELYLDDFQYFGPAREDRNLYIKDDDEDEDNDAA